MDEIEDNQNVLDLAEEHKAKPAWKVKMAKILDHWSVVTFMTLITIYALFFDDIRMLAFPKSTDDIFYGITLVAMIAYTIEIICASIAVDDYFLSFFFWLDLISTISMIPDCGWIWNPIISGSSGDGS